MIFSDETFSDETLSGPGYHPNLNRATFSRAIFPGEAYFDKAAFCRLASFDNATFSRRADFSGATFSDKADFSEATFKSEVSLVNAELKNKTLFKAVKFLSTPPALFGAKLHEGTVWRDVRWLLSPTRASEAGDFVDAYERLKLEMDRLKKHEDELEFFAREMRSRQTLVGFWRSIPIAVYGILSDYGRSYVRPVIGLTLTIAVGAGVLGGHFGMTHWDRATGISLANTFGALGFRKDLLDPDTLKSFSGSLRLMPGVQTVLGIVFVFLFDLALKNRFRMK